MDVEKNADPAGFAGPAGFGAGIAAGQRTRCAGAAGSEAPAAWATPRFEVLALCCEITAYAPDDEPLF